MKPGRVVAHWRAVVLVAAFVLVYPLSSLGQETAPKPADSDIDSISQVSSPEEDQRIKRRLDEIFANSPDLGKIDVKVEAGVVELGGEVPFSNDRERATQTASKVTGVVSVLDNIQETGDLKKSLAPSLQKLMQRLSEVISKGPIFLIAGFIVLIFWGLGRLLTKWDALFHRLTSNQFLAEITRHLLRGFLFIIGLVLAFDFLGATAFLTTLLGAAGVAGLAIGFAIRDVVENYIASILLSVKQPFCPHDHVVIDKFEGKVIRLTTRATILMTLDGVLLRIPNAMVFKGVILNYTRNPFRRFDFEVTIATDQDLAKAQAVGLKALENMQNIARDPPAQIWVEKLGDSRVWLHVYAWVDQQKWDWFKVRSECIRRFKKAFDQAGIEMPEPIYNLKIREPDTALVPKKANLTREEERVLDEAMDLQPDRTVDEQIQHQKIAADQPDLLDSEKPQE